MLFTIICGLKLFQMFIFTLHLNLLLDLLTPTCTLTLCIIVMSFLFLIKDTTIASSTSCCPISGVKLFYFRRRIHPITVRNRLRSSGLKARRPYKATRLTLRYRQRRLQLARQHIRFNRRQWGTVLFTDECLIKLSHLDGRRRI